ncbi:MAG: CpaF family protein [Deltaproteobacteria bacterium]|nr:CpaF family protein [Deltaproteobacteria bacterium]
MELETKGFRIVDHSLNGTTLARPAQNGRNSYNNICGIGPFHLHIQAEDTDSAPLDTINIRKDVLEQLVHELKISEVQKNAPQLVHRVESVLERLLSQYELSQSAQIELREILRDEALGLGPLETLLKDDTVSEIMVVRPDTVYVERKGIIEKSPLTFSSETSVRTVIDRIVAPLGRRVDEASPMVDARLADGSRVNAVIPPLAIGGSAITIRKFSSATPTMDDLVSFGSLNDGMAEFLCCAVASRQNIVISGGTGSGKTTLLNILSAQISPSERIVTIEDAAELKLQQPHVVSLETRPENSEGRGVVTIRDLVKNALRMRPDRIIVGECRGGETLDMLQAMNTGHDGSLTTTHANSPTEAITRLETLTLLSGLNLPARAIKEQICGAIDIIVQQKRFHDGKRRITAITEVGHIDDDGNIETFDLWRYNPPSAHSDAKDGSFQASGRIPRFQLLKG